MSSRGNGGRQSNATGTLDRRSVRSRRMIYSALVSLMEEKSVDGITVGDITERADLNRSTFYSHFKDKDDLICKFEDEFLEGLTDIESRLGETSQAELAAAAAGIVPLQPLVELFQYLASNSVMLQALLGPKGDIGFEHRLMDTLCTSIVDRILSPKYKENPTRIVRYYVSYFSSASLGIVRTWIEDGMVESPEEMARIMLGISLLKPGDPIAVEGVAAGQPDTDEVADNQSAAGDE